jgi:ribosomal protein S18 acetylase RimI-like enzyme
MKNNMQFKPLAQDEPIPYKLLLLADPSKELIDQYLQSSTVFIAAQNEKTIGAIVLYPLNDKEVEIKNIAVEPALQGQGIGHFLIENAINITKQKGNVHIYIGTANSSIGQLYLYQKMGFEMHEMKKNFFIEHYPNEIYEKGIQAKHLIVLKMTL